jgi:hypothetical protein
MAAGSVTDSVQRSRADGTQPPRRAPKRSDRIRAPRNAPPPRARQVRPRNGGQTRSPELRVSSPPALLLRIHGHSAPTATTTSDPSLRRDPVLARRSSPTSSSPAPASIAARYSTLTLATRSRFFPCGSPPRDRRALLLRPDRWHRACKHRASRRARNWRDPELKVDGGPSPASLVARCSGRTTRTRYSAGRSDSRQPTS